MLFVHILVLRFIVAKIRKVKRKSWHFRCSGWGSTYREVCQPPSLLGKTIQFFSSRKWNLFSCEMFHCFSPTTWSLPTPSVKFHQHKENLLVNVEKGKITWNRFELKYFRTVRCVGFAVICTFYLALTAWSELVPQIQ